MSEQARNYYGEIIKVQGMDTDLTVHCDVFGTLLEDFSDEPKLNAQLMKALEWFSNEGYDVRIVSSDPDTANRLLEKTNLNNYFLPVLDRADFLDKEPNSMAILIDDKPSINENRYAFVCNSNTPDFQSFISAFDAEESAPDPQGVKRILIIDDDLGRWVKIHELFQNVGVPVEVGYANYSGHAIEIVNEWIDKGYKIDAISCDDNRLALGGGELANEALEAVLQHIEDRNVDLLPDQLFVHSKGASMRPDLKWGEVITLDTTEFTEIARETELNDPIHGSREGSSRHYYNTRLREWCNQSWGTNFPLSASEASFKSEPDKKFGQHDITQLLHNKTTDAESAFDRLDIDSVTSGVFVKNLSGMAKENFGWRSHIEFKDATGDAVVGRLAFNGEDVEQLRSQDITAPIVLCIEEYDPSYIPLLKSVNGVVFLGEGSEHFKLILENAGVSGVLTLNDGENRLEKTLSIEGKNLTYTKKNYNDATEGWDTKVIELSVGDTVSIDSQQYRTSISSNDPFEDDEWTEGISGEFFPTGINFEYESVRSQLDDDFTLALINAADDLRERYSGLGLMSNADTPDQFEGAISVGAEGVGLVRSEHMFYEPDRLELLQNVMLVTDKDQRQSTLDVLGTMHSEDIESLLKSAQKSKKPFPVTFRLLDAPLEEFLLTEQQDEVSKRVGSKNTRGVQFADHTSGLYEMQVRALSDAVSRVDYTQPIRIMIPHVKTAQEVSDAKSMVTSLTGSMSVEFGVMIETTNSVENIEAIAQQCDFISFGTNDLTADVMGGVNRIDYDAISKWMMDNDVHGDSPFKQLTPQLLDQMALAIQGARQVNPNIHISACGQQMALDPKASQLAISMGLDGISVPNKHLHRARLTSAYYANAARNNIGKELEVSNNSSPAPNNLLSYDV